MDPFLLQMNTTPRREDTPTISQIHSKDFDCDSQQYPPFCLTNIPSRVVQLHNMPEVESKWIPEAILRPIFITRTDKEQCLIETSINFIRVSIKIVQANDLENLLTKRFIQFLLRRSDNFIIFHCKCIEVSSSLTNFLIHHRCSPSGILPIFSLSESPPWEAG